MEQRTPEWFAARRNRITASMVGGILGHSPFMTRADVLRAMVRQREGYPSEFVTNPAVEWGNQNEDGAIFDYEMETMHDTTKVGFLPYEDWAGCSPDRLIGKDGGLEVKCPFFIRNDPDPKFKTWAEQEHYTDQVQFSLFVTGRKWWHAWQWTPFGSKLETIYPDPDWQDENLPKLRQFYAEFLSEPADDHAAPPRVVIDTPDAARMMREWDEIAEQMERLEERKKDLLASMTALTGGKDALIAGRKLTLTKRAGSVSYAKVVKEHCPSVDLEPYRGKPSSFWKVT